VLLVKIVLSSFFVFPWVKNLKTLIDYKLFYFKELSVNIVMLRFTSAIADCSTEIANSVANKLSLSLNQGRTGYREQQLLFLEVPIRRAVNSPFQLAAEYPSTICASTLHAVLTVGQSREWVDGSWVMGQMGHENRMGHMGHGSLGVDT